jgi:hypothetical protein
MLSLPACILDDTSESELSDMLTNIELPGPDLTATQREQLRRHGKSAIKRQCSRSDYDDEPPTKKFRLSPSPEDATDGEESGASGTNPQDVGYEIGNRPEPSKFECLPNEVSFTSPSPYFGSNLTF